MTLPGKYFAGVHDVVGIECMFDAAHHSDSACTGFFNEETLFVQANAMFSGAGAAYSNGAFDDVVAQVFSGLAFLFACGVYEVADVVVAVSDVAHGKVG